MAMCGEWGNYMGKGATRQCAKPWGVGLGCACTHCVVVGLCIFTLWGCGKPHNVGWLVRTQAVHVHIVELCVIPQLAMHVHNVVMVWCGAARFGV